MYRSLIAASAAVFLIVSPAFANHCERDIAAINAALSKVKLSDEVRAYVIKLRDKGQADHDKGDHPVAEATLAEAMRQLLNGILP